MRIKEKTAENIVFFPKNTQNFKQFHTILLHSELTNKDYKLEQLTDKDSLIDYYKFVCNFLEIPNGEYIYTIDDNAACGLIILGEVNSTINNIEYVDEDNNKYIVYDND